MRNAKMEPSDVTCNNTPVKVVSRCGPEDIRGYSPPSLAEIGTKAKHSRILFSPGPATMLSPVTNLALNMNNLAGLGSHFDTPKRKKHGPMEKVPSFASDVSSDAGLGMDPQSPMDATDVDNTFEKAIQQSSKIINEKVPFRRNNSLPLQLLGLSPSLKGQEAESHRYGIFGQQLSRMTAPTSECDNKENMPEDSFEFKKPTRPVSRCRVRSFNSGQTNEDFARRPSSAPALFLSSPPSQQLDCDTSPVFRRRSSTTSLNDDDDDGFLEVLDDDMEYDPGMPMGMAKLLTAPLVASAEDSPVIRCRPRSLFRSSSAPSPTSRPSVKRPECPLDENTPQRVKRRRSLAGSQLSSPVQDPQSPETLCTLLQRSKSFCHTEITKLLDEQHSTTDLIGDFSKPFVFPVVNGKHEDLKYITPQMMVAALSGQFSDLVERLIIIDCRYPYEFEGGHIKGALNLHQEDQVEAFLFKTPIVPCNPDKRVVIVFHCEFSFERGPRMCRFVRKLDRDLNCYPALHYPELYVLNGGYKGFYPHFRSECEPQSYRPMHHKDFREDLGKFRSKSRTWAGERSKREMYSRLKKL